MRPDVTLIPILGLVTLALLTGTTSKARAHPADRHEPAGRQTVAVIATGRTEDFDFDPPRPGAYRLPPVKPAGDGVLVDSTGMRRRLFEVMADRITILSFVYTRCADARGCPLATAVLSQIFETSTRHPVLAQHLALVTISFDPGHDTPTVMARYAPPVDRRRGRWAFLTAPSELEIGRLLRAYGQPLARASEPAGGLVHLLRVYLIDRQHRIRNIYGVDFLDPRLLVADVQTLLLEEGLASGAP